MFNNSVGELTIHDDNLRSEHNESPQNILSISARNDMQARKVFGIEDDTTKSSTIPNNSTGEPIINDDNSTVGY